MREVNIDREDDIIISSIQSDPAAAAPPPGACRRCSAVKDIRHDTGRGEGTGPFDHAPVETRRRGALPLRLAPRSEVGQAGRPLGPDAERARAREHARAVEPRGPRRRGLARRRVARRRGVAGAAGRRALVEVAAVEERVDDEARGVAVERDVVPRAAAWAAKG